MGRTTITVDDDVHELLQDVKHDDESWTDCLRRLATDAEPPDESGELDVNALVDDIAAETSQRTANELENRLTRR